MVIAVALICYGLILILWIWTISSILKWFFAAPYRAYVKPTDHAVTRTFENVLGNIKKDSSMVLLLKEFSDTLRNPYLVRVYIYFISLIGSVPSHYLTDTSSQFPTPTSIDSKPTQALSQSNLCTIWKMAK